MHLKSSSPMFFLILLIISLTIIDMNVSADAVPVPEPQPADTVTQQSAQPFNSTTGKPTKAAKQEQQGDRLLRDSDDDDFVERFHATEDRFGG